MNHAHGNEPCSSGKVAYKTRTEAQKHMQVRKQKMSCYECPECGAIHITTAERSPLKRRKKVKAALIGEAASVEYAYFSHTNRAKVSLPTPIKAVTNLGELLTALSNPV